MLNISSLCSPQQMRYVHGASPRMHMAVHSRTAEYCCAGFSAFWRSASSRLILSGWVQLSRACPLGCSSPCGTHCPICQAGCWQWQGRRMISMSSSGRLCVLQGAQGMTWLT